VDTEHEISREHFAEEKKKIKSCLSFFDNRFVTGGTKQRKREAIWLLCDNKHMLLHLMHLKLVSRLGETECYLMLCRCYVIPVKNLTRNNGILFLSFFEKQLF
jgi:hypothetical protein